GKPMLDLIVPPSLRDQHRKAFQHHLQTGKSSILGARIETTGMRAGGTEFPVELAIARVESVGPPIFTAYLRDITERRMAEEHLRSSEERLRLALDAAKLRTFGYDVVSDREVGDGRLAAIFGLRPADFPQTVGD